MGLKRIVAPDQFNRIIGCYFDEIANLGHTPIYLMCRYYKNIQKDNSRTVVDLGERYAESIVTRGPSYVLKRNATFESSPKIHLHYRGDPDLWDDSINKICAVWGKDALVYDLLIKNRENNHVVYFQRHATENGRNNSKLVLLSINDVPWRECHFQTQRTAAGDFWDDTCEFKIRKTEYESPTCKFGAHA